MKASVGYQRKDEENLVDKYDLDMNSLPRGVIISTIELAGCDDGALVHEEPRVVVRATQADT